MLAPTFPAGTTSGTAAVTMDMGLRRYRGQINVRTSWDAIPLEPAPPLLGAAAPTIADLEQLETGLGRKLDLWRIYHDPRDTTLAKPLLDPKAAAALAGGRRVLVSFTAPWADVAGGKLDAALARYVTEVATADPAGNLIDVCFGHEPDTYGGKQNPNDFRAGFTNVALAFHRANPQRTMVLALQAWSYRPGGPLATYYPGDESVDLLGADGYNWAGQRPAAAVAPASQVFGLFLATAARMGKATCIPEFNTGGADSERAAWLADAIEVFTAAGVLYACLFNSVGHDKDGDHDWRLPAGSAAIEAVATASA